MKYSRIRITIFALLVFSLVLITISCGNTANAPENTTTASETASDSENSSNSVCSHNFETVPSSPATCNQKGHSEYRICLICGEKEGYEEIAESHNYVTVPQKPATDFESGHSEYRECVDCGKTDGYVEIEALHKHELTVRPDGESNPMFFLCKCGFSVVSDIRSRPLINQLSDKQFAEFQKLYNMFKNREPSCKLDISENETELFYDLIQGQCPELFLLEYQNASPTMYLITVNGKPDGCKVEWNPNCMSEEEYAKNCAIMIDTLLEWERDCRDLTDIDKVRYMVRWLVENTEFETIGTNVRSLYGAIIEREIACVGYAQVLSWTMNLFGVPCMSVSGIAGDEGHMWNIVELDGEWYQVDAGWNYVNIHGTSYSHNGYVAVTDRELNIGTKRVYHSFYSRCEIKIPECTATAKNIARLDGNYISKAQDVSSVFADAFSRACQSGESIFTLICKDRSIQDAVYSYAKTARNLANDNRINNLWIVGGHDDRTNIYFVSVLMAAPNQDAVKVSNPTLKEGVGYKLAIKQNKNGQIIFFSGSTTEKYLSTVSDPARATDVFYKEVEGGFRLWFIDGYMKKYVDIAIGEGGAAQATLSLFPSAIYHFDDNGAIVATVDGKDYWLGTYNEYSTIGASDASYITGVNADNIGVSQFPAMLVTVDGTEPAKMAEPEIPQGKGTAYKLQIKQNNLGKTLYFQGWRTRNFPASTTDRELSPNVYLEKVDGGYQLYYLWGENKMYINAQTFQNKGVSLQLRPEPGAVFTYNDKLGLYTVKLFGVEYYIGTYSNYDNFSLNDISYITGENASNIGASQFPAYLVAIEE